MAVKCVITIGIEDPIDDTDVETYISELQAGFDEGHNDIDDIFAISTSLEVKFQVVD